MSREGAHMIKLIRLIVHYRQLLIARCSGVPNRSFRENICSDIRILCDEKLLFSIKKCHNERLKFIRQLSIFFFFLEMQQQFPISANKIFRIFCQLC